MSEQQNREMACGAWKLLQERDWESPELGTTATPSRSGHIRKESNVKRTIMSLIAAIGLTFALAMPAAAHSQTVTPPGGDGAVVRGPISNAWAQAHCHAQAPAVVATASNGVVVFSPPLALPCPDTVTNPGGQVTGP